MSKDITIGELVKFVLDNRRGFAFKDYDEELIASGIISAIKEGTLLYACETDGSLCGIVVAEDFKESKIMFVHDMFTTSKWVLKQFINIFRERWPEHTIKALRKGYRLVTFDTNKLCNLTKY